MLGMSLFHNTPSFYHHLGQNPKLEGYPGLHLLMRVKGNRNLNKIRITQEIDSTLGTLQIVFSSLQYMFKSVLFGTDEEEAQNTSSYSCRFSWMGCSTDKIPTLHLASKPMFFLLHHVARLYSEYIYVISLI